MVINRNDFIAIALIFWVILNVIGASINFCLYFVGRAHSATLFLAIVNLLASTTGLVACVYLLRRGDQ